jgi:hypothetical protein
MKNKILLIDYLRKELKPECREDTFQEMILDSLDYNNFYYFEMGLDLDTLTTTHVLNDLQDIENYVIDVYNE